MLSNLTKIPELEIIKAKNQNWATCLQSLLPKLLSHTVFHQKVMVSPPSPVLSA